MRGKLRQRAGGTALLVLIAAISSAACSWRPARTKISPVIVICALLLAAICDARQVFAYDGASQHCSEKVKQFVAELDSLLQQDPNDVVIVNNILDRYFPISGCDIDDVIAQSSASKFYSGIFDATWAYTVSFKSDRIIVTFGIRKTNGNIILPAARIRTHRRIDKKV